jgi:hypothetical protein
MQVVSAMRISLLSLHRGRTLVAALALSVLLGTAVAPRVAAQGIYADDAVGYDVSYPQCRSDVAATVASAVGPAQFGIVGVNRGRAYSDNACLADEYQAIAAQGIPVSLYLNLNAPSPGRALPGAAVSSDCNPGDLSCADYQFGWNAAAEAYQYASQALLAQGVGAVPSTWWLDIETMNYWYPDKSRNDQIIQGALDYLTGPASDERKAGASDGAGLTVGIYSTPALWAAIAGRSYQPGVPAWVAGARTLSRAPLLCSTSSFTGGPVWLVQQIGRLLDVDYACPASS